MEITPADNIVNQFQKIGQKPYTQGLLLIIVVIVALVWANSSFYKSYFDLWHQPFTVGFSNFNLTEPLHIWINDGLMAVFFFYIGLEIKKEVIEGELSSIRKASLPVFAAIGGMLLPAVIFLMFNNGTSASNAWGIPMATDIAFALGIISLLKGVVSSTTKVFLTAVATVDDLGAILVIALFLTPSVDLQSLIASGVYFGIMLLGNKLGVRSMWFYLIIGVLGLWIALFLSGIHATLAGVLGAFAIPANQKITEREYQTNLNRLVLEFNNTCRNPTALVGKAQREIIQKIKLSSRRVSTPLMRVTRQIAPLVHYLILPLFAFCNSGVRLEGDLSEVILSPLGLGIILGLVVGKSVGIVSFTYFTSKISGARSSSRTIWSNFIGVGFFGGIGFTMSLFIAELALQNEVALGQAKISILVASVLSASIGIGWFLLSRRR